MSGADIAAACRLVVAGALAVAAAGKFADRDRATRRTIAVLGPAGRRVATILPAFELFVAVLLLAWWTPVPGLVAVVMFGAFTVVLVRAARRGLPCPCFGGTGAEQPPGAREFTRNAVLAGSALLACGSPAGAGPIAVAVVTVGFGVVIVAVARRPR